MQARASRTVAAAPIDAVLCIGFCAAMIACAASRATPAAVATAATPAAIAPAPPAAAQQPWRAVVVSEDESIVDPQLVTSVFGMRVRSSRSRDDAVLLCMGGIRARFQNGVTAFARENTFRPIV